MLLRDYLIAIQSTGLTQAHRPLKLRWGPTRTPALQKIARNLLLQRVDIKEGLYTGIEGYLTCLSTCAELPLKELVGLPISVQWVTDQDGLHTTSGIVTEARVGCSDGSLATYQLTMHDAISVMERRTNTRTFRNESVIGILSLLVNEWRSRSNTMAGALDIDFSYIDQGRYPTREHTQQWNESDAHFFRRLCRREGINWFIAPGKSSAWPDQTVRDDDTPIHTIVLFDEPRRLPEAACGAIAYRSHTGVAERDAITQLSTAQQLTPGAVKRATWDYKTVRMEETRSRSRVDQGDANGKLSHLLVDAAIEPPHTGDSRDHFSQQCQAQMAAFDSEAITLHGMSGVRDLRVGRWCEISEDSILSFGRKKTPVIFTSVHHRGENNLPKDLNDAAVALFQASGWRLPSLSDNAAISHTSERVNFYHTTRGIIETRYENTFTCVPRGQPLHPHFDPRVHFPPVHPMTAIVVGPPDEQVHCDALGRVHVQIQGMDPEDHEHASGAGTSGTPRDSAPVRVSGALAGEDFGDMTLPRVGSEVVVECLNGDPDKLFISGVLHNGASPPAAFSHVGKLPFNRYVSGTKTQEIRGRRYNQLRFDDTSGQISSQLASEHAHSQLNLGYLTHPRNNGYGEARGEGAELRSDAAAAVRAAKGILLTTYARHQASGQHLDRDELIKLLDECSDLFKTLADYAVEHGGSRADKQGQHDVARALRTWTSATAQGAELTEPNAIVAIGAQAGSLSVTPKTHVTYAGENVDQIAQQHLQLMAGKRLNATAGDGVQIFARGAGVQAVAAEGPVAVQARSDAVSISAQSGVTVSSNDKEVLITAPTIRLVAADGSFIRIGDGITLGTQGDVHILSASHQWGGPSTEKAPQTAFNAAPTDQRFRLHYPSDTPDAPAPAANRAYQITLDDGRIVKGKTDANGLTSLVKEEAMRIAKINICKAKL